MIFAPIYITFVPDKAINPGFSMIIIVMKGF